MLRPRVTILCSMCGGASFRSPQNPKPDDRILCNGCGIQRTYRELEAESIARTKRLRQFKRGIASSRRY